MGREIRKVIPNWEHPKENTWNRLGFVEEQYQPMFDESADEAFKEWLEEYQKFKDIEHEKLIEEYGEKEYPRDQPFVCFCECHGDPPDPKYYRPQWAEEEMTWWQVYETVSEGTPVSPPFETQKELVDYLVKNGDFWNTSWSKSSAERFVYGSG